MTTTFAMSTVIKGNKLIFFVPKKRKEKWHLETTLLHAPVRFFEERISLFQSSWFAERTSTTCSRRELREIRGLRRNKNIDLNLFVFVSNIDQTCSRPAADDVIPEGLAAWRFHGSYLKVLPLLGYGVRQKVLNSNVTIMSFKTCVRREKIRRKRGVCFLRMLLFFFSLWGGMNLKTIFCQVVRVSFRACLS